MLCVSCHDAILKKFAHPMTNDPNPYTPLDTPLVDTRAVESKFPGRSWFIVPTMISFIGLLFTNHYYHTGKVLISCLLWQYYVIEARNGFPSLIGFAILGGPENDILSTMASHLGLSALPGLLVYGLRWLVLRGRKES
jgi:hypothetical protein